MTCTQRGVYESGDGKPVAALRIIWFAFAYPSICFHTKISYLPSLSYPLYTSMFVGLRFASPGASAMARRFQSSVGASLAGLKGRHFLSIDELRYVCKLMNEVVVGLEVSGA
jgi:hypothetical protein